MRHTDKKTHLGLTTFALLIFLHLCVFTAYRASKKSDSWSDLVPDASHQDVSSKTLLGQRLSKNSTPNPDRYIYPHSVIRGGVRSADEFKAAILKDSVVAAHYSDFNTSRSRIISLKSEKAAYVSYRINNKVYWTKKKVKLAKGEHLITDGTNYARARCGNRISDVSQAPTSDQEPAQAFLDTPIPAEDKDPLLLTAMPKSAGSSSNNVPPAGFGFVPGSNSRPPGFLIPGIIGGGAVAGRVLRPHGNQDVPVPPVTSLPPAYVPTADVPEPGTLLFMVSGIGSAIVFRRWLRR